MSPAIDIFENDQEFLVLADVPGATEDEVELNYDQSGARRQLALKANGYARVLTVPDRVDAQHITAKLSAGVLELRLPKHQPRKIAIQA